MLNVGIVQFLMACRSPDKIASVTHTFVVRMTILWMPQGQTGAHTFRQDTQFLIRDRQRLGRGVKQYYRALQAHNPKGPT